MALSKKGALLLTHDMDRIASVIAAEAGTLGVPAKVAAGFAEWCDRLADRIENTAGIDPEDTASKEVTLKEALSGKQAANPELIENPSELKKLTGPLKFKDQGEENLYFTDGDGKTYYVKDPTPADESRYRRYFTKAAVTGYDAGEIGEEVGGALEHDADEYEYMSGQFTQQNRRELREKQEAGSLASPETAPRSPRPGVQANFENLSALVKSGSFEGGKAAALAEALKLATDVAKSLSGGKAASHGYNLNA